MSTSGLRSQYARHTDEEITLVLRKMECHLKLGNYQAAREVLLQSEYELEGQGELVALEDVAIASLCSTRLTNAIYDYCGAVYVPQLDGITPEDLIENAPNVGEVQVAELVRALASIGVMMPVDVAAQSLVDVLETASQDDLNEIDEKIRNHEASIAKLKRARKAIASIVGGVSSNGSKQKRQPVQEIIVNHLKDHDLKLDETVPVAVLASELGLTAQSVRVTAGRGKKLRLENDEVGLV